MTSHIALITGGNRGLGRAAALAAARQGIDIVLTYRSGAESAADAVAEIESLGRRAVALQLDTTAFDRFDDFAGELRAVLERTWQRDRIDALVNNAGVAGQTQLGSTTAAQLDELYDVHVKGVYLLTQSLLPLLADGGRILNVSSGLARFVMPGGRSMYGAMKGAVEVLTRYWAEELAGRGISVNVIAPGATATDFGGGAVRDIPALSDAVSAVTAFGRPGRAEDIGSAVATLLAGDVQWITGQRIEASGGMRL